MLKHTGYNFHVKKVLLYLTCSDTMVPSVISRCSDNVIPVTNVKKSLSYTNLNLMDVKKSKLLRDYSLC